MTVLPLEYAPVVLEHFERPRNFGRFEPAENVITARAGHVDQGAVFSIAARIHGAAIEAVRFEVFGCPHCVAAGSWVSERLVGATLEAVERWAWTHVAQALDVPPEKRGRLLILEDAVRALAAAWRVRT